MIEVSKGWLAEPVSAELVRKSECIPVRRFGVKQGDKVRLCDNCKRARTNEAAAVLSKIRLPGCDDLAEIARVIGGSQICEFFKADHESAYKQLPANPAHARVAMIALSQPGGGGIFCFKPRTLIFGSPVCS